MNDHWNRRIDDWLDTYNTYGNKAAPEGARLLKACKAEIERLTFLAKSLKIQIPTQTMEHEFSNYHRLGYNQAKQESKSEIERLLLVNEVLKDLNADYAKQIKKLSEFDDGDVINERDALEDVLDKILDEVLGFDRQEWSSSYGYNHALTDVIEHMDELNSLRFTV